MWYFGLLLLQMCTKDAPTLFQATQADNLIHNSDFHSLAYLWDTIKLERIGECFLSGKQAVDKEWSPAIDLCLWCLQGRSERRPPSFSAVFEHRFFDPVHGELRFLDSVDEPWEDFVVRQAAELHAAIASKNSNKVEELFNLGTAYFLTKKVF